ncbi:tetratricopeptide repeat protein [Sphingomonas silueang]|uniref:tetratricopeptide repeat protein n=1 Tax=Sphingomonas silueang TaxID=3156617 RepID=UPI0032B5169D
MTDAHAAYVQLRDYLAHDPDNAALIADTARAAHAAGALDAAAALADRHDAIVGAGPEMAHLRGLIAMARRDWAAARGQFERLRALGIDAAPIRFNLAWSLAMLGEKDDALALLDAETVAVLPAAAQLRIGIEHERGDLDAAEATARAAIDRFPGHAALHAAVATLAIDLEDADLARRCIAVGAMLPPALAAQGVLALADEDVATAAMAFDAALAGDPGNGRALIGSGLVALHRADPLAAARLLDRGAAVFGNHLGSWIAAGWAWLIGGDRTIARERFERALAVDPNFADAHGSLAVIDLVEGDIASGRSRTGIALRLDRACFSGALAAAILAGGDGDAARAEAILEAAMSAPLDGSGRTLAQMLARIGGAA